MKKKLIKKKGILFWITGLSGSGKTKLSKRIKKSIIKNYGPTVLFSGDDIRQIFNLKGYSYKERYNTVMKYCLLSKFITSQDVNVIFAVVGLMSGIRKWNKKNIDNYIEIYIKSDIKKIKEKRLKKIYRVKTKQVVGIDIKPEIPTKPDITIVNNFNKNLDELKSELILKLEKILVSK